MAATSSQLIALGNDAAFRQRVRFLALQQAAAVCGESAATPNHSLRLAFAVKVIQNPGLAEQVAPILATRTNLVASGVSYNFTDGQVVTDASDAAVLSQLASDWDLLAGQ